MWTRKLSCFCYPCSGGEWDNYESTEWVDSWDRVSLPNGKKNNCKIILVGGGPVNYFT